MRVSRPHAPPGHSPRGFLAPRQVKPFAGFRSTMNSSTTPPFNPNDPFNWPAIRAEIEANLEVSERYHPGRTFHLRAPAILGAKTPEDVRHYPQYILDATPPSHFDPNKVLVSDVDGVFTDGPAGHFFHHFCNDTGLYSLKAKSKVVLAYVMGKNNFATLNEIASRLHAGHLLAEIRKNAQDFFDHVVMNEDFNKIPLMGEDSPIDYPFIHRDALLHLKRKHQEGYTTILASGSLRYLWKAVFAPENIKRYAARFFDMDLPDTPMVDFFAGGAPKFGADGVAISEAEKPLSIGDGKRLLVEKLMTLWGINRETVEIHSDDVHADRHFLLLARDQNRFATNIPEKDIPTATVFGHQIMRLDGLTLDGRTPEHLELIKKYRELIIQEVAVEMLRGEKQK